MNSLADGPPGPYLARLNRADGLGAVAHSKLMAIALADYFGMTYVGMDMRRIAHSPDGVTPRAYARDADRFFNFDDGELRFAQLRGSATIHYVDRLARLRTAPGVLNVLAGRKRKRFWPAKKISPLSTRDLERQLAEIADDLPSPADVFLRIQDRVRARYDRGTARSLSSDFEPQRVDVAIHIRRGDVVSHQQWNRFTPNAHYLETIRRMREVLGDRPHRFHVFSQSHPRPSLLDEDFQPFVDLGCCMHLDADVFETMHHLVTADVLVTSKSSFSYLPAVLSRGIVLYEPFWHHPMSPWIQVSDDGGFDTERLWTRLSRVGEAG